MLQLAFCYGHQLRVLGSAEQDRTGFVVEQAFLQKHRTCFHEIVYAFVSCVFVFIADNAARFQDIAVIRDLINFVENSSLRRVQRCSQFLQAGDPAFKMLKMIKVVTGFRDCNDVRLI